MTYATAILRSALTNSAVPVARTTRTVTRRAVPQPERPANDPQYEPAANATDPRPDPRDHIAMVHRVAARLAHGLPPSVLREDLSSAGFEGLVMAARRFDASKGIEFEKYAEFRIKGAMLDEIRKHDMMSRGGRRLRKSLDRVVSQLTAELGRPPGDEEVAASLDIDVRVLQDARNRVGDVRVVSLEASCGPDDAPMAPVDADPTPESMVERRMLHARASRAISQLEERERLVIDLYFRGGRKLQDIAARIGTTDSRVCQIKRAALRKLRAALADA